MYKIILAIFSLIICLVGSSFLFNLINIQTGYFFTITTKATFTGIFKYEFQDPIFKHPLSNGPLYEYYRDREQKENEALYTDSNDLINQIFLISNTKFNIITLLFVLKAIIYVFPFILLIIIISIFLKEKKHIFFIVFPLIIPGIVFLMLYIFCGIMAFIPLFNDAIYQGFIHADVAIISGSARLLAFLPFGGILTLFKIPYETNFFIFYLCFSFNLIFILGYILGFYYMKKEI